MGKLNSVCLASAIALGSIVQAQAMPAQILGAPGSLSSVVRVAACGPGTHLGPYGHYCWPNKVTPSSPCPVGTHLGPHGKYCWPNGTTVPSHWSGLCPPGYHLGPEGKLCIPGGPP